MDEDSGRMRCDYLWVNVPRRFEWT